LYYKKIVELRDKCGISQEKLADNLGVNKRVLSSWEQGLSMPDIEYLNKISNFFDVSIDFLLKDDSKNSGFNYYPITKPISKTIGQVQLISLVLAFLSILTFAVTLIVSLLEPLVYYDITSDKIIKGLAAYWFTYNEIRVIIILALLGFVIALVLLLFSKKRSYIKD